MIQLINAIFQIIFSLFEALFTGIGDILVSASSGRRKETYNADFLPVDKLLSKHEKGYCLTGDRSLSIKSSYSNAICFGASSSGKSSIVLLPSILKMTESSLVIHDPSKELFLKSAQAKKEQGFTVKVLDYTNPLQSQKYNPLYRVKTISDIKKLSKILVQTTLGTSSKDNFWNVSAENLLSLMIRYTIFYAPIECQNLNYVLKLIEEFTGSPKGVDIKFVGTKDEELLAIYKSILALDQKMMLSITATASASLSMFSDPEIAEVTKRDTIDFEIFRKEKTILYINNSVNNMAYYSVITSIFFQQFFASIMQELVAKNDLSVFFLLDEASSLQLSILPIAISNIRKYNAGIFQIYQSQNQLLDLYGMQQGRNILANSYAKVYMPGVSMEVARELEIIAGKFEYEDEHNTKRNRSLITMDEIRTLKDGLLVIGNHPLIKAKLVPYYEQNELKRLTELPPYCIQIEEEEIESETDETEVVEEIVEQEEIAHNET
jgi:type IV secretion system protein VirD4